MQNLVEHNGMLLAPDTELFRSCATCTGPALGATGLVRREMGLKGAHPAVKGLHLASATCTGLGLAVGTTGRMQSVQWCAPDVGPVLCEGRVEGRVG